MRSPEVALGLPPGSAGLVLWSRDDQGDWWALVEWLEHVNEGANGGQGRRVQMSGWIAGGYVSQLPGVNYANVPRQQRSSPVKTWPGLDGRDGYWIFEGWHVGILNGADPLPRTWTRRVYGGYPPAPNFSTPAEATPTETPDAADGDQL